MKIIKTLSFVVMSLFLVLSNISVLTKNVEGFTLKSLTDQKVEYNDTVSFEFMERLEAPTPKQNGRGEPLEKLVSDYGDSYINDPYLHDEVVYFRRWQWKEMYSSLDAKAKERPDYLDTYRLQAEAYLVNKEYKYALSQLDRILRVNPLDVHALSLSILANKCGALSSQTSMRLKALKLVSPNAEKRIRSILKDCDDNNANKKNYSGDQLYGITPDVIAVFGQSPNADGTPSEALLTRLTKTKEMADKYPNVTIGMVNLFKTINAHKILCVGTILHCPRAMTVLTVYGKTIGYDMTIDVVGGGNQPTQSQMKTERIYTYVNAFRAGYFYSKEDFSNY